MPERSERSIPKQPGTYALILHLRIGQSIQVGKLGSFDFPPGHYIYIGSAFGPGGLTGRLGRHLRPKDPHSALHWHIDYLRRRAPIVEIWFATQPTLLDTPSPREHEWAALVGRMPGSSVPAPRFGASDCRCQTHLYHFKTQPAAELFRDSLRHASPADETIHVIRVREKTEE